MVHCHVFIPTKMSCKLINYPAFYLVQSFMESTVFVAVFVSASTEFKQWLDNVIWFSFRSCEEQGVGLSDPYGSLLT